MPSIGTNIGVGVAAGIAGLRVDPYQACNFVVEIEGLLVGGFSECSGLQIEIEAHEYREGGQNDFVHRFAGAARHPPLVLKHGLSPIDGLWGWHQDVAAGDIRRRNGTIYLLNKQMTPVLWWHFREALPLKWSGPELNAAHAAVAVEAVELAHRGLTRARTVTSGSAVATAAADLVAATKFIGGFF
ncbi:MAG TPA: phage tail protein [Steroidobacteraceae bacterium]|jgi:phage tail-like protein|nr:phage tail protein [Steroidobacteraceae bacterium]